MYPTPEEISSEYANFQYLPESLRVALRIIFSEKNAEVKIASIGQAIIQAARPTILIAPLQIGLGVQLHHHFASKFLIDTLYSMGFCLSYSEIQKYESSAAVAQKSDISEFHPHQFIQYAADNVDHNIRTLDGHNTFHGMGMIACVTPGGFSSQPVPKQTVSTEQLLSAGSIDISFYKPEESVKPCIAFSVLKDLTTADQSWKLNLLAKVTWPIRPPGPEWSGLMQMVHVGENPGQSSVTFLPMIDMNPSDMSCIFSTLSFISDHAKKYNQTPIVTFDQPLYWKALMIIHHGHADRCSHNIVLRLGGFHAEMSFLGCIGHLMQGSGLAELLETVYASNAVGHMLQGKAVARALRGHFLVDNALHALLVANIFGVQLPVGTSSQELSRETRQQTDVASYGQSSGVSVNESTIATDLLYDTDESSSSERHSLHEECIKELKDVFESFLAGTVTTSTVYADEQLNTVCQQIKQKKDDLKQYPTAALWIQYMEMIEILRTFITAERTGNWELSLYSLQQMLPYFAAAGHNLYLKSVYVYLQMMFRLQDTNPTVYEAFRSGLHIIRRSDRFCGGLPPDLVIEQVLMRSVKTTGGMTRGKGMTECQHVQWLLSMPSCAAMNVAMQTFCGTDFHTSSQHKEMGKSRMERDYKDSQTFLSFLTERNPFFEDSLLRNIETGVTADASVNTYKAKEIGNNWLVGWLFWA